MGQGTDCFLGSYRLCNSNHTSHKQADPAAFTRRLTDAAGVTVWIFGAALCVLQRLDNALKSSLRSDMEDVTLALLMSPANFDAYLIRKATKVQSCAFHSTFSYTVLSSLLSRSSFFCRELNETSETTDIGCSGCQSDITRTS